MCMANATYDYPTLAKRGFALGVLLFALGAVGGFLSSTYFVIPSWETTLLFDAEVIGVLVAFFSPLVFGIVLPLIE
jgi:hypothetical protein